MKNLVLLSLKPYHVASGDNNTNQLIAKSLLEQVGIKSLLPTMAKAVEQFQKNEDIIDLILMDLHACHERL